MIMVPPSLEKTAIALLGGDGWKPFVYQRGYNPMQMANELASRIAKVREMLASMEDEARIQRDAIKDLKERENALVNELLLCLNEE